MRDPAPRVALIEGGSPGLNIYSHVAMGRGVALLATVLRDRGYDVRAFVEDISGKGSVDWSYVRDADIVGFSSITCTLPCTAELLERARAVSPNAVIVLGGPEPSCCPERSFEIGADYVLRGEAEHTLPLFIERVLGDDAAPLADVPGLVWRENGRLQHGPEPRQLQRVELNALPLVNRSLVADAGKSLVAAVWRARGCPEKCDFCEVREIWPRHYARSNEQSVAEVLEAQAEGYETAFLIDDNAAANKPMFMDFLRKVSSGGFARMLVTQIRADAAFTKDGRIDREFLKLLKKAASVTVVCIGVESAADSSLEGIHKRTDSKTMARALKAMKRYGLLVHGMFIALKDDDPDVVRKNGGFARRTVTSLQYLFETPLPGTLRTVQHEASGSMLFADMPDLAYYDGMHVVLRPERMSPARMQELVGGAYRSFYSVPRVVMAAVHGALFRFRVLSEGQRAYLRQLRLGERLRWWARFHLEYKFAPASFLAIGYKRVRDFMRDPDYARYLSRLRDM